jgi:hypothetical protein
LSLTKTLDRRFGYCIGGSIRRITGEEGHDPRTAIVELTDGATDT